MLTGKSKLSSFPATNIFNKNIQLSSTQLKPPIHELNVL